MPHGVDTLRLAVHSPPGREVAAVRLVEQFTREVLEQFTQALDAHAPGRVVLIRRMAVRWSLSEAAMTDPASAASCAAGLADSVAVGGNGASHVTDTIVTFDDEAGWLAAYLRARAAGAAGAWFHAAWRQAESRDAIRTSPLHRQTALAALSRLQGSGELAGVLPRLPPATTNALGVALGIDGASAPQTDGPAASQHRFAARGRPAGAVPGHERSDGLIDTDGQVDYRDRLGASLDDGPVDAVRLAFSPVQEIPLLSPEDAALAGREAALIAAVAAAMPRADNAPYRPVVTASIGPVSFGPATRFGGLFYLLAVALELGIGEVLWKVCLPEGLILAHAAAALLGPDASGDLAPVAFGGVTIGDLRAYPPVAPEQQAEISIELLAATAAALPRYGAAPAPEVFLDLVPSPAGRMLVASGLGPFALFAWPAPDARATAAGVAAFLSVWPGSFPPPQAREVLLGLNTSGRLRAAPAPLQRAAPLLPAAPLPPIAPTAPVTALLAQVCGAMAELLAVRAADAPATAAEVVSRYLVIPGHVALTPEAMTVVLPMAAIDVALRRAALDRDPGWVPWLRRTVRIEFVPPGREDVV